jgi:hypothetical protein
LKPDRAKWATSYQHLAASKASYIQKTIVGQFAGFVLLRAGVRTRTRTTTPSDVALVREKDHVEALRPRHDMIKKQAMHLRTVLVFAAALGLAAQQTPPGRPFPAEPPDEIRLPNGKLQRDEILKAEYQKSIEDARELSKLADELKLDLEKNDRNVLSIATLKKTEQIEKLAKRIHDRLKHG